MRDLEADTRTLIPAIHSGPRSIAATAATLFAVAVPIEGLLVIGGRAVVVTFLSLLIAGSYILSRFFESPTASHGLSRQLVLLISFLLVWVWATALAADNISAAALISARLSLLILTTAGAVFLVRREGTARSFFLGTIAGTTVLSASIIASYVAGSPYIVGGRVLGDTMRYSAGAIDPNYAAVAVAVGLSAVAIVLGRQLSRSSVLALIALSLVHGFAVVLTGSRGGIAAALVATLGIAYAAFRAGAKSFVAAGIFMIPGILLLWSRVPAGLRSRYRDSSALLLRRNEHNRADIWEQGLRVGQEAAVFGHGPGGTSQELAVYFGTDRVSHSTYITLFGDFGLVGLVLFASTLGLLFVGRRGVLVRNPVMLTPVVVAMVAALGLNLEQHRIAHLAFAMTLIASDSTWTVARARECPKDCRHLDSHPTAVP